MNAEYRIEYTIQRAPGDGEDFVDVGFGSSGGWNHLDAALHAMSSEIQNGCWETEGDMPSPEALIQEQRADHVRD